MGNTESQNKKKRQPVGSCFCFKMGGQSNMDEFITCNSIKFKEMEFD